MERLTRAALAGLDPAARPLVAPGDAGVGILHLGLGAFFRAHQAVFTEAAMAAGGGDWGIVGVAPRSRAVLDPLLEQDLLFSVLTLDGTEASARVCGVLAGGLHAAGDPDAVARRIADPDIRIITLTVTEKAYRPDSPVMRVLMRGLAARGGAPVSVVSCDNLSGNGAKLRALVTAELPAEGLSFPGTMVDRIVPASTEATYATAANLLGVEDRATVAGEPFTQWVIEDDFAAGRPAWERAGAILTDDAAPYERMKLRVLNGVHSAIAYLGALAGAPTIDRALALPGMRETMERFIAEDIAPTLEPPPGMTVEAYGQSVLHRFANSALGHRTLQVAMDGTQKLPQRLLGTVADRRAAGACPRYGALVIAAWMRFVRGTADDGSPLPLDDPLADRIRATPNLLELDGVFPAGLAGDDELRAEIAHWARDLERHGVAATLKALP
ncbi:mannitol dehydrogenase family protein [Dactylosporangium sp. AC04546]|uniref:mannitol dehydrogenase family protein n=1 Tax=Dactylosporangium sp. AC04546 TaxID=2862460 RepID=UPI001EDD6D78|nr:mannitol dehydrogenase family protein [Dactylosporangium sp. AC04546]WVK87533.1 mannitol dehydrogenase family protein [Dactylosporangium sp. AC04546]